jgi:hypothetical protein
METAGPSADTPLLPEARSRSNVCTFFHASPFTLTLRCSAMAVVLVRD